MLGTYQGNAQTQGISLSQQLRAKIGFLANTRDDVVAEIQRESETNILLNVEWPGEPDVQEPGGRPEPEMGPAARLDQAARHMENGFVLEPDAPRSGYYDEESWRPDIDDIADRPCAAEDDPRRELGRQLAASSVPPGLMQACLGLIDLLDVHGYITDEIPELAERLKVSRKTLLRAIKCVQSFGPPGIAARDCWECKAAQLAACGYNRDEADRVVNAILKTKRSDPEFLARKAGLPASLVRQMLGQLLDPHPWPDGAASEKPELGITPDFLARPLPDGTFDVSVMVPLPSLSTDMSYWEAVKPRREYKEMRRRSDDLVANVRYWETKTTAIIRAIVNHQKEFLSGKATGLQPLLQKDIAAVTGAHESLVSRISKEKYIHSPAGVMRVGSLFSVRAPGERAEGALSKSQVCVLIKEIISRESVDFQFKSDPDIQSLLEGKGIELSRRTVANYRKAAGIPSVGLRRDAALNSGAKGEGSRGE